MPRVIVGDMWAHHPGPDVYVVTTNAVVTSRGALVMGCGAALECRLRFDGIEWEAGLQVRSAPGRPRYGYLEVGAPVLGRRVASPAATIGLFQTKHHFRDPARLDLIALSARMLGSVSREFPARTYYLNFPGVGAGKLPRSAVEPCLAELPDNVTLFLLPERITTT